MTFCNWNCSRKDFTMDDEPWESIPWDFDDYLDDAHDAWAVARFFWADEDGKAWKESTDLSFQGKS